VACCAHATCHTLVLSPAPWASPSSGDGRATGSATGTNAALRLTSFHGEPAGWPSWWKKLWPATNSRSCARQHRRRSSNTHTDDVTSAWGTVVHQGAPTQRDGGWHWHGPAQTNDSDATTRCWRQRHETNARCTHSAPSCTQAAARRGAGQHRSVATQTEGGQQASHAVSGAPTPRVTHARSLPRTHMNGVMHEPQFTGAAANKPCCHS
jgi:hypothetical protein